VDARRQAAAGHVAGDRGEIVERSGRVGRGRRCLGQPPIANENGLFSIRNPSSSRADVVNGSRQSPLLRLSVSLPPKLGVTTAETEHMAIYLGIFLRVLSS
jgi:hypothetical protein